MACFVPAGGSPNKINSPKASPGGKYSKATVGSPYRGRFLSVSRLGHTISFHLTLTTTLMALHTK